jgi:hypothetical protein
MEQVTNVSELRDVEPTAWAFEALRSLVERYGCIVGYPDRTFRGNQALTRYEFAAGLNACMDRISELIAASTADLVKKEDLLAVQRLQEEFAAELAALRGRIDALDVRTATLQQQQFSATTKLLGEVIFSAIDAFGGVGDVTSAALQYRAALYFVSSFTGKDVLTTGIKTGNAANRSLEGGAFGFDLPGTVVPPGFLVPSAEGTLSSQFGANLRNQFTLTTLEYQFPVGDRLRVYVGAASEVFNQFTPTLNPYFDDNDGGRGAISAFGQRSPLYRLAGGPGIGLNYQLNDQLALTGGYLTSFTLGASNPNQGVFDGTYAALAQVTWKPSSNFGIAATYVNSYATPGRFGFNNLGLALTGTAVANTLGGQIVTPFDALGNVGIGPFRGGPVVSNSYGAQVTYQPSPGFVINGWFGAIYSRLIGKGDGQILTYAVNFGFPDLGKKGNLLGLVVGAEPYLTSFDGGNPQPFKVDVPLHIEAFYRYQINNFISLTPGVIWLTAPNQDSSNPDDFIVQLRTTFNF